MKVKRVLILITICILIAFNFRKVFPKKRDLYSTHYYLFSGKRIYLGMTKEEIEKEAGTIINFTDDYHLEMYGYDEYVLYKGKSIRVHNEFLMEDKQVGFHSFKMLTGYKMAKTIVEDYSKILLRLNNIRLEKGEGDLSYHGDSKVLTSKHNKTISARAYYNHPYLEISFSIHENEK